MKRKLSIILVLSLFIITACAYNASLINTSFKALSISQTSYNITIQMAADLDSRGLISTNDKAAVIHYGTTYSTAHNSAVEALAKYSETKDSSDSKLLEQQMTIASEALSNLLTIIKPYLED